MSTAKTLTQAKQKLIEQFYVNLLYTRRQTIRLNTLTRAELYMAKQLELQGHVSIQNIFEFDVVTRGNKPLMPGIRV